MFGLGKLGRGHGRMGSGGGSLDPRIILSASTISENALVNDVVGTLSVINGGAATWTFTVSADPDAKFDIADDDDLIIDATVDYETAASHSVTILATPDVGDAISRQFTITVTNVPGTLSTIEGVSTAATTADLFFILLNEGNGDLDWVVTQSATAPTGEQIKAGQNHLGVAAVDAGVIAVVAAGEQTDEATGLTNGQSYYLHAIHEDAGGADSNIVTSAQWTQGAAPVLENQTVEFGRETRDGAGGYHLVVGGGGAETLEVTVDDGTNPGDWEFDENDRLVPMQNGGLAASYTLTVQATNPNGTDTATITINTIARGWSVRSATELTTVGQHASLELADEILLRDDAPYNAEQSTSQGINRSTPPTGTFTPPSLLDASHPDKGPDLDTGNYVVVKPHTGASPVIARFRLNGTNGGTKYFRFTELAFVRPALTDLNDSGRNSSMLAFDGVDDCAADNCTFVSEPDAEIAYVGNVHTAITSSTLATNIYLIDNTITDVWTAIGGGGVGNRYIGNDVSRFWGDGFTFKPQDDMTVAWNVIRNVRRAAPGAAPHVDFMQFNDSTVSENIEDMRIVGNRFWAGDIEEADIIGQCYFGDDMPSPYFYIEPVFIGNMGYNAFPWPFRTARWQDAKFYNNVTLTDDVWNATVSTSFLSWDGGVARFNINHGFTKTTPINPLDVESDNIDVEQDLVSLAVIFDDPQTLGGVTDLSTQFSIKSGSEPDLAAHKIGAAGTGYIDYAAREYDFPWDESGFDAADAFTDATNAEVSTLTTSAPVQITGISATGALVEISGAGSPQFRITSDEAGSTVVTDWTNNHAVIQNNEWLWLRDTSSADLETAVSVTISIGTSSDTWTITTESAGDVIAPALSSVVPNDNATGVAVNADIVVTWDENIVNGSGTLYLKRTSDDSTIDSWAIPADEGASAGQYEISGGAATFHSSANRAHGTEHYIVWDAGIFEDAAGNGVAAQASTTAYSFTTRNFITPTDSVNTTASSSSLVYTFSGVNIGANVAGQGLAFIVTTRGGAGLTIESATFDTTGIATRISHVGTASAAAIFAIDRADLPDPTQTDVDIEITLGTADGTRMAIDMFVIDNPDDITVAADTATDITSGTTVDCTIDVPAGGGLLVGLSATNYQATAWTPDPGLNEVSDFEVESGVSHYTAYGNFASAQLNLDVNATGASNYLNPRMVAASWGPA